MTEPTVHFPEKQRFELTAENTPPAYVSYRLTGKTAVFDHTYVPDELRGQGIAAIIVKTALQEARKQGWEVVPACSYIGTYIRRHPEFSDLLAP